jgi:hypothetical protein
MANTINADNGVVSTVPGLKYSADTSGELILQTNTTNALTLDTTQGATFSTGALVTNPYAGSYSSGMVLDHTTSLGRISVAASSAIAFYNGGISARVETMRIDSAGNVGIGTATPAQKLDVSGAVNSVQARFGNVATRGLEISTAILTGTNDAISVLNAKGGGTKGTLVFQTDTTERMRIDASGNVGIGTSTTTYALNVFPATNGTIINAGNGGFISSFNGTLYLGGSASVSSAGVWTARSSGASIFGLENGGVSTFYSNTGLTNGNTFSPTERMRLTAAGELLIGKTSSAGKALELYQASNAALRIQNSTTGVAGSDGFLLEQAGLDTLIVNYEAGALAFYTSGTERMRISSNGNVGIGTTSSSWPLTVSGAGDTQIFLTSTGTNASGQFIANGNGAGSFPGYNLYQSGTNYWTMQMRGDTNLYLTRQAGSGNVIIPAGSIMNGSGNPILRQTGSVLQVVSTNNTTRSVTSQTTSVIDMPGMTVSITPTSTTSKIFVMITLAINSPDGQSLMVFLDRNGTQIGNSTSSGGIQQFFGMALANTENYRLWTVGGSFLDSPGTTSALTYKLRTRAAAGSSTLYLNGTARNSSEDALGSSTITVMEIAA